MTQQDDKVVAIGYGCVTCNWFSGFMPPTPVSVGRLVAQADHDSDSDDAARRPHHACRGSVIALMVPLPPAPQPSVCPPLDAHLSRYPAHELKCSCGETFNTGTYGEVRGTYAAGRVHKDSNQPPSTGARGAVADKVTGGAASPPPNALDKAMQKFDGLVDLLRLAARSFDEQAEHHADYHDGFGSQHCREIAARCRLAASAQGETKRCDATRNGGRCAKQAGHIYPHQLTPADFV